MGKAYCLWDWKKLGKSRYTLKYFLNERFSEYISRKRPEFNREKVDIQVQEMYNDEGGFAVIEWSGFTGKQFKEKAQKLIEFMNIKEITKVRAETLLASRFKLVDTDTYEIRPHIPADDVGDELPALYIYL